MVRFSNHGEVELTAYAEFLEGLIRNPSAVSAPTASSPTLARAIASKVDPCRTGYVIELGPGTGVVTKAILERGVSAVNLIAIEQGQYFVDLLKSRFPNVTVLKGDAMAFGNYLPKRAAVASIVSGLPLLNFPKEDRSSLIGAAMAALEPGGRFIQLSYGWKPPLNQVSGVRPARTFVWRNFPPAFIWTYQKDSSL